MSDKTICFFNSNIAWGGGEKWHYGTAKYLKEKNYPVLVIAHQKSELFKNLKKIAFNVEKVSVGNLSFINPFKIFNIYRTIKKNKVEVIIMNMSTDVKTGGIAAKLAGVKKIIYRRGLAVPIKNSLLNRFLFKKVITDVIANSLETKNTLLTNNQNLFPKEKIKVIYNGLDLHHYDQQAFEPIYQKEHDEIVLGNAGRLVEQKGQKYLIHLAQRLKEQGLKFKLLIAGVGKLEPELKQLSKEFGVEKEILFLGFIDNIKGFMESIDIFLLSSLWEGFGYVITEAMASQKPVVAFDISSNPEVVSDGESGYLAEAKNMDDFYSKVEKLMTSEKLRDQFGKAGRKLVEERFTMEKAQKEVESFINYQS
ncbi:glycosyltransferase [Fulvivirgaceae bacterium BMA10]|uniref:Glycosyltransferase n=1 Tax=Splendidivirga corallicola TaxID=3051826 RepID=A0ABT8KJN4_9BACT|nr:glycosyltransferase [Fulvivirgaceae bacterium BMA10]